MTSIEIELLNWDKYNPRKDLKATTWMRFQNSIFENPQFFDFDHSEICFWIYLLCMASKAQKANITVNIKHAEHIGRFKRSVIDSSIKKLIEIKCIESRYADVTLALRAQHTTNERNERTDIIHVRSDESTQVMVGIKFDLESLYKNYPKRQGNQRKAVGMKSLSKIIKQQTDFDDALRAVKNYKQHAITSKTEGTPMVAMFATFFGRDEIWKEWIDRSAESTTQPLAAVDFKRLAFGGN